MHCRQCRLAAHTQGSIGFPPLAPQPAGWCTTLNTFVPSQSTSQAWPQVRGATYTLQQTPQRYPTSHLAKTVKVPWHHSKFADPHPTQVAQPLVHTKHNKQSIPIQQHTRCCPGRALRSSCRDIVQPASGCLEDQQCQSLTALAQPRCTPIGHWQVPCHLNHTKVAELAEQGAHSLPRPLKLEI